MDYKNIISITILIIIFDTLYLGVNTVHKTRNIADLFNFEKGKNIYLKNINNIQKEKTKLKMIPTILCYIITILILNYFVIEKAKKEKKEITVAVREAFFLGILIYGLFGLSFYSIMNKWKLSNVIIETLYGGIVFAAITFINLKYIK